MLLRNRLLVGCVAVAALFGGNASAQTSRTIKIVVPVPPGASTDFAARLMGDQIARMQGVTVVNNPFMWSADDKYFR